MPRTSMAPRLKAERRAPSPKEISFWFRKTRRIGSAPLMVCSLFSRYMCRARDAVSDWPAFQERKIVGSHIPFLPFYKRGT